MLKQNHIAQSSSWVNGIDEYDICFQCATYEECSTGDHSKYNSKKGENREQKVWKFLF